MPIVPRTDGPAVAPNALPQARFDAPNMPDVAGQQLQQMGRGLMAAGQAGAQIVTDVQHENNSAEAKQIDAGFTAALNDLQFNPDSGFMARQGKGAVDTYLDSIKAIDQVRRDALNSSRNPRVKEMIAPVLAERAMAVSTALDRHYVAQRQHWQVQSSQDRAEVSLRDAASNFADPEYFARSLGTAHQEADAQGKLLGWDEATTRLRREQYTDSAFKLRYENWRQQDAAAALGDFQKNAGSISPLVREQIGRQLFQAAEPQLAAQINAAGGVGALVAPSAADGPVPPSRSPRGERSNNPGNIVRGSSPWEGEVSGADARFASFATPEAGIRAMGKNLLAYQDGHGINTVEGIISRWAPSTENDTGAYVRAVSKAAGVGPRDKIDLHDPATLAGITKAIIQFENGRQPYSDQQISLGLAAAQGTAQLPPAATSTPATAAGNPANNDAWRDPAVKTGNATVDALAPDQKLRVLQMARTMAHQDMEGARTALNLRVQDSQAEYMARGTATNPPMEAEFMRAYGQAEGLVRFRALQDVATLGGQVQQIKTLPEADLRRTLVESVPQMGEGFAERERNHQILIRAVEQVRKARTDDPIKTALANPAYGIKPLTTFANPQAIATDLGARGAAMERIARDYGTPPVVMTEKEAEQFGTYLDSQQPADKARVLGQVSAAVGPVGMQSISAQLKEKNSTLAIAGALASRETTAGNSAAKLYLEGKEMLGEKRAKIDAAAETGIKARIFAAVDGVYLSPQARDAAADATFGIYAKLKTEGSDDVERALRLATGGLMDFNGAKVAKPYGWPDARFSDAMKTVIPAGITAAGGEYLVAGQKVAAQDFARMLPGARLQTYGDGSYLVKAGNDVVRRADGLPFILKVGR